MNTLIITLINIICLLVLISLSFSVDTSDARVQLLSLEDKHMQASWSSFKTRHNRRYRNQTHEIKK